MLIVRGWVRGPFLSRYYQVLCRPKQHNIHFLDARCGRIQKQMAPSLTIVTKTKGKKRRKKELKQCVCLPPARPQILNRTSPMRAISLTSNDGFILDRVYSRFHTIIAFFLIKDNGQYVVCMLATSIKVAVSLLYSRPRTADTYVIAFGDAFPTE